MIARTIMGARCITPNNCIVSLGVGLGLAASFSIQRETKHLQHHPQQQQQQGLSSTNSLAAARRVSPEESDNVNSETTANNQESSGKDAESKIRSGEEPTLREDVLGSYENRIRNFSSSERVFEFFASVTNEKGTFMTPADFARSITPYQHRKGAKLGSDNFKYNFQAKHYGPTPEDVSEYKRVVKMVLEDSRVTPQEVKEMLDARKRFNITAAAHLKVLEELGVKPAQLDALAEAKGGIARDSFIAMIDIDGDGLISYEEYMLFRTLLALPRRKLSIAFRMFDKDDSGAIDSHEFESFMEVIRGETNAAKTESSQSHKKYYRDVAHRLFFTDSDSSATKGSGQLTLKQFTTFVQLLQREALVMQFNQWDRRGEGFLSATDFAKFLVTKVNIDRQLYKVYLKRAESAALAKLEVNISLKEFLAFHEVLQHLPEMEVAMKVSGSVEGKGLSREVFVRAVHAALTGGRLRQQAGNPWLLKTVSETRTRKRDILRNMIIGLNKTDKSLLSEGGAPGTTAASAALEEEDTGKGGEKAEEVGAAEEYVISAGIVDALFTLLDINGDGLLDQNEFMTLMKRQSAVPDPPRNLGIVAFIRRWKDCVEDAIVY